MSEKSAVQRAGVARAGALNAIFFFFRSLNIYGIEMLDEFSVSSESSNTLR
jgi:hypothetical protein